MSAQSKHPFPYSREECPDRDKHTPRPDGYLDFVEWARKKAKTHRQERCPTCRLWVIWKPRKPRGGVCPSGKERE